MVVYKLFNTKTNEWITKYGDWTPTERLGFAFKQKSSATDQFMYLVSKRYRNGDKFEFGDVEIQQHELTKVCDFDSDTEAKNHIRLTYIAKKHKDHSLTDLVGKLLARKNWDEFKFVIVFKGWHSDDVKSTLKNSGITKGNYRTTRNAIAFKTQGDLFMAQLAFAEKISINVIDLEQIFSTDVKKLLTEIDAM